MTTNDEYLTADPNAIGLDRADIHRGGRIELPEKPPKSSQDHRVDEDEEERKKYSTLHRVRISIGEKKHDTAVKIKKTLHISDNTHTSVDDKLKQDESALADPVTDHSHSRLKEKLPVPEKATMKDFLHDPIQVTKKKLDSHGNEQVAANIAASEISHGQEVDLLNAQSDMLRARTGEEEKKARETFEELLKERQNMFVRWTLDRHITKVRIMPKTTFVKKTRSDFETRDPSGNVAVDWKAYGEHLLEYAAQQYGGQYIGYGFEHPKPSKKTIMPNIERLVVASAPFQELIMTTRRVYRWESGSETMKYLVIYSLLWYMNMVFPGILSAIVFFVVHRRYSPNTMQDLRQDIEHTENRRETALTLTEFIEKEGDEEWADKIIAAVGPWLMIQLGDMANMFEVMRNFYEWRVPTRTVATLCIMVLVVLISAFVPAWLFIRAITLGAGIAFFGLFPISVNLPEYRLLASLPKRLFWDIPTHAEWALTAIQAEGTRYREEHTSPTTSTAGSSGLQDHDYGIYTASWNSQKGRLAISQSSVRFITLDNHVHWRIPYRALDRIEKIDRIVDQKLPILKSKHDPGTDMKIVSVITGGREAGKREWVLEGVEERDRAFSQAVGFSGRSWQVVW